MARIIEVPARRHRDTQDLRDSLARQFDYRDRQPIYFNGFPSLGIDRGPTVQGIYDKFHRIDMGQAAGAVVFKLPKATTLDVGRSIRVANISAAAGTITVRATPGQTVNGLSTSQISTAYGAKTFRVVKVAETTAQWFSEEHSESEIALAGSLFQWNAADATQFDSLRDGSSVSASAVSVITAYSRKWLRISVTANGSVGGVRDQMSVLRIKDPSGNGWPADYRIEADYRVSTYGGTAYWVGYSARNVNGTKNIGDGYSGYSVDESGSLVIARWNTSGTTTIMRSEVKSFAMDTTTETDHAEMTVEGSTLLGINFQGAHISMAEGLGTFTAAGQPALLVGIGTGTGARTTDVDFRNIRVWAI